MSDIPKDDRKRATVHLLIRRREEEPSPGTVRGMDADYEREK